MTKQEVIKTLLNAAWLGTNEEREKTEEAVKIAISNITILGMATDYLEHFRNGMLARPQEGITVASFNDGAVSALESAIVVIKEMQKGLFDE